MFSSATDLADPFRHLLQVVKDALGGERRRGLFSGPLALLTWMRTRRERKEQEEALHQFKALLEEFLALLADFRAEKPAAEMTPPVAEVEPQADLPRPRQSGASWQRIVEDWPVLRFSALYAVGGVGQEYPSPRPSPTRGEGEGTPVRAARRDLRRKLAHALQAAEPWNPACPGMTSYPGVECNVTFRPFTRSRAGPGRHAGELQKQLVSAGVLARVCCYDIVTTILFCPARTGMTGIAMGAAR